MSNLSLKNPVVQESNSNLENVSDMSLTEIAEFIMYMRATHEDNFALLEHLVPQCIRILDARPNIVDIHLKKRLVMIGDLHGELDGVNLVHILFKTNHDMISLFLGDYVDRGNFSLEILMMLMLLILKDPETCFPLRGNHEDMQICDIYGFNDECIIKFGKHHLDAMKLLEQFFCALSLGAVINGNDGRKAFAAHGGPPIWYESGIKMCTVGELNSIDRQKIRFIDHYSVSEQISASQMNAVIGLTWSDPSQSITANRLIPSPRGLGYIYDHKSLSQFLDPNGYEKIYRAHQVTPEGHQTSLDERCVTLFSVANYGGQGNLAALACLSPNMELNWFIFSIEEPTSSAPNTFTSERFVDFLDIKDLAADRDDSETVYAGPSRENSLSSDSSSRVNSFSPNSSPRGGSLFYDSSTTETVEDIVRDMVNIVADGVIINPLTVFNVSTL